VTDRTGQFVISLDFELLWGLRDQADKSTYGRNILGGRTAIPLMLDLFAMEKISATWATVGFLFCKTRDELMDVSPPAHLRPKYENQRLSNYEYLTEVGKDEAEDPYYFAGSLIDLIAQTPGQEIATHTFSHFYTLEKGATLQAFKADLQAAKTIAQARGISMRSIVFPRNQFSDGHVTACAQAEIDTWRGNPPGWVYASSDGQGQTLTRRGVRLIDAYSGLGGALSYNPENTGGNTFHKSCNVPASRFLRPCSGPLAVLHPSHIAAVKRGMTHAAKTGRGFHLWWHPHNFGADVDANMYGLRRIIDHYKILAARYGMQSMSMEGVHT
jgi:peptidoglycan/xylan/chitin deacetylase (PgdA/CDA1 family)